MSQQTHDTPLPAPVAFALYFMLSDLATTFLKLGSPWGQGLLGALFGLLISRFLPVDRFAFPVLIALLTVACDSLFGQVGRYTPSLYLYVLSNATTGMAIAFATALSLRRGEREPTDQPPWTLVSLGYALFPLISQWVSMLLGQLEQHVFGESREVPADAYYVYWFLVSLCASAAPGWLVARGLGADKIASESDPGPVVGVGSAALVALFVFGLGDSLMDLPRNRAIEIILAISTVASGCVAARYLYTEAAISKAKAVGISSIWLIAAAIAIAAWLLLAPEVGSPLDYERFPPPPPPPFGGDIGYYDNPSDFSLFYLAWSALGIGAACSLVSCLLMSPDILRAVKTATAVAVAFQVAAMLTLLLAGRNFGTLALGWGCCAYFCAQLMERFHRSERFLA
ncbi:MAG: hypothetical protein IPJ27_00360 [Candidatus Accumulibacter sp.]|uniref:Uncharacterized protein n=1 Tax=Candidatus Accumulibacter proximus TaxID=2954385 RepID=A0A935UE87_9PROT|nr:hypothetical protein [Candidatus Accumulibacter proximus]